MGEYQEVDDFDDLLDSDGEDDVKTGDSDEAGTDILDLEDLTIRPEKKNASGANVGALALADEYLHPDLDDIDMEDGADDEGSDDEEAEKRRTEEKKREAGEHRRKLQKSLHSQAPGIDLFLPDEKGENGLRYFHLESLDIERDFGYSRRSKLHDHGFSDSRVTDMLTDRLEFVRHLMPEAQSVLLCDAKDFRAIMDFLFFSISVCTDRNLSLLMTKALFDLRKNYSFKWTLGLRHVLAVLLNFGASEDAVYKQTFYQKSLEKHIEAVRKSGQKAAKRYELPELPDFLVKRRLDGEQVLEMCVEGDQGENKEEEKISKPPPITPAQFKFCLESFILLLTDFSAGQPQHLEFRYKNNWSDQIILLYLLLLLGTDKRLVRSWRSRAAITMGIHYHLDSFASAQWYWGPDKDPNNHPKTADGRKDFNQQNVCKSLVMLINEFFPGELCPASLTWPIDTAHASKVSFSKNGTSDHHLNMIARLGLIPPSLRGNQLKKYLSFVYLQTIAEMTYVLPTHVDVFDVTDIPELCSKLSASLKLIVSYKNYDVITTVVELYDNIVGHEPETDFTKDKVEAIELIRRNVLQWIQKKLPNMNNINTEDERSMKGIQLSEFLDIVKMRWQTHCSRFS